MAQAEFPSNSARRSQTSAPPPKEKSIKRVTTVEATRRKKPLGTQFREVFIAGNSKTTAQYVFFNVLIPAAKDALADAGSQAVERLIYGEATGPRRRGAPYQNLGHVNYQGASRPRPQSPQISDRARSAHDFGEIVIPSRADAEEVLDSMFEVLSRYDLVSVADLYDLVGMKSTHADQKWGWDDLKGASIRRVRHGGFLLDLPKPVYLA